MIALVVPCFNETSRWNREYWYEMQTLRGVRWLIVDDGSEDCTESLARHTGLSDAWEVVRLSRNRGKGEAVRFGIQFVNDWPDVVCVGFMDADGAFCRGDVEKLCDLSRERLAINRGWDAVWSSRIKLAGRHIERLAMRHYLGRGIATVLSLGDQDLPYDTQSGLKVFARTDQFMSMLDKPFSTRWLFEVELLIRWHAALGERMRVWEEPLLSWNDVPGSKLTGRELARAVWEVAHVKSLQRQASRVRLVDAHMENRQWT